MKQTFLTLPRPFVCALVMQPDMPETIARVHMHNHDKVPSDRKLIPRPSRS